MNLTLVDVAGIVLLVLFLILAHGALKKLDDEPEDDYGDWWQ
jgi:hypothetical protein